MNESQVSWRHGGIGARAAALCLGVLAFTACSDRIDPALVGTLEWDRATVLAEVSEPVIEVLAQEGDIVQQGAVLLRLDPRRTDAELAEATAMVQHARARLAEAVKGARIEDIDAARAEVARAQSDANNAATTRERYTEIRRQGLISQSTLDDATNALRMARASEQAARARLAERLHGTRPEQIAQVEAALDAAEARRTQLELTRERLDVRAPHAGRVDALPFRLGDQPPAGASLVTMLTGTAPYARVHVPERRRAAMQPQQKYLVHVDGTARPYAAHVRMVSSEASFTPYYALSGDDASRLVYRAELMLDEARARELPAGLPVNAEPWNDAGGE